MKTKIKAAQFLRFHFFYLHKTAMRFFLDRGFSILLFGYFIKYLYFCPRVIIQKHIKELVCGTENHKEFKADTIGHIDTK